MTPDSQINPGVGAESGSTVFAFNPAMEGKPLDPSLRAQAEAMAPQTPAPEVVVTPQPEAVGVKVPVISEDVTPAPEAEIPDGESDESLEEALKSSESGVEAPIETAAQETEPQPEPAVAEAAPEIAIPEPEIVTAEEPVIAETAESSERAPLEEKIEAPSESVLSEMKTSVQNLLDRISEIESDRDKIHANAEEERAQAIAEEKTAKSEATEARKSKEAEIDQRLTEFDTSSEAEIEEINDQLKEIIHIVTPAVESVHRIKRSKIEAKHPGAEAIELDAA